MNCPPYQNRGLAINRCLKLVLAIGLALFSYQTHHYLLTFSSTTRSPMIDICSWVNIMLWHLASSRDLNYPSKRHASKVDSNFFDFLSKRHAFKLDSNLSNCPSEHHVSKLDSDLSNYLSERYTSKLDSNLSNYPSKRYIFKLGWKPLKCPSNTTQPPKLGSKRITTVF